MSWRTRLWCQMESSIYDTNVKEGNTYKEGRDLDPTWCRIMNLLQEVSDCQCVFCVSECFILFLFTSQTCTIANVIMDTPGFIILHKGSHQMSTKVPSIQSSCYNMIIGRY